MVDEGGPGIDEAFSIREMMRGSSEVLVVRGTARRRRDDYGQGENHWPKRRAERHRFGGKKESKFVFCGFSPPFAHPVLCYSSSTRATTQGRSQRREHVEGVDTTHSRPIPRLIAQISRRTRNGLETDQQPPAYPRQVMRAACQAIRRRSAPRRNTRFDLRPARTRLLDARSTGGSNAAGS